MITVISSLGDNKDAQFDLRFGRAAFFCIYNEDTKETKFIANKNKDAQGGAGTKTVETMVELGVEKVISGDFGPKAQELLEKFNIQMVVIQDDSNKIKDIINKLS